MKISPERAETDQNSGAMPQSLSKVYTHIIFSTKNRIHLIDEQIQPHLFDYLGGICKALECNPVLVGGHLDHVHILCLLSKKITQVKLLEEVKKRSSKWIKTKGEKYSGFYWQNGYGIFSVSPSDVGKIANYIKNQKQHHRKMSFKEELMKILKVYNVEYDEKYLWD